MKQLIESTRENDDIGADDQPRLVRRAGWEMLAGAVLISFSAVFVRLADVGPSTSAFYRMAFGGVLLLIVTLALDGRLCQAGALLVWRCWRGIFLRRSVLLASQHFGRWSGWRRFCEFPSLFCDHLRRDCPQRAPSWRYYVAIPLALAGLLLLVERSGAR